MVFYFFVFYRTVTSRLSYLDHSYTEVVELIYCPRVGDIR